MASLLAQRRWLVLHLPRWATDYLKRADAALAASTRPLALWEKERGAMRIVALDARAAALGLFTGQPLSDARAIVPALEAREIDRGLIAQGFADFADWHSNASPIVSILQHGSEWGDIALDITGVSHLFGGEERMLVMLTSRLEALGITVAGGVASSLGTAWAMAHYSPGRLIDPGDETKALAPLPVAALRLEIQQVESLRQLGLKQIGQLLGRDRSSLKARFGANLLHRLDQALGLAEEKITPRLPLAEHYVERRFPEPIGLIEEVLMTARDLAITMSLKLERLGLGAQTFHLMLYRVDHKVMALAVNAARATRDAIHIGRLFAYRAERLGGEYDAGFGIDMIRLGATSLGPLDAVQTGAFAIDEGAASLELLYDRMTSRLGPLAVVRNTPMDSHIPEHAMRLEPLVGAVPPAAVSTPPVALRPLRLLPSPEPVTVSLAEVPDGPPPNMIWRRIGYRFVRASGPERIAAEWWASRARLLLGGDAGEVSGGYREGEHTRDYFIAEDDGGRRFWLFRQGLYGAAGTPRWFVHGFFA
jgi:protein ImuB